jgi:hypothetical protein
MYEMVKPGRCDELGGGGPVKGQMWRELLAESSYFGMLFAARVCAMAASMDAAALMLQLYSAAVL